MSTDKLASVFGDLSDVEGDPHDQEDADFSGDEGGAEQIDDTMPDRSFEEEDTSHVGDNTHEKLESVDLHEPNKESIVEKKAPEDIILHKDTTLVTITNSPSIETIYKHLPDPLPTDANQISKAPHKSSPKQSQSISTLAQIPDLDRDPSEPLLIPFAEGSPIQGALPPPGPLHRSQIQAGLTDSQFGGEVTSDVTFNVIKEQKINQ